jgi:putative glutamine amidotransferase
MTLHNNAAPLIGLPSRMDPGTDTQYLSRHYADAILDAGGIPVIIPLLENPSAIRSLAETLDGILLTGSSSDVDPREYGADREPACGPVQPLRDATDFQLLDIALNRKKPVLGICFGMQSVNVFLGGSLIQDIDTHIGKTIVHDNSSTEGRPAHGIEIIQGSVLHELVRGDKAEVNSTHHQAIDRVAPGLEVIARAPDGVVESVISRDSDCWILGVQWHPEKNFRYDTLSKKIFELFLSRCRTPP